MQVDTGHDKVKVENSADLQMSSLLGILSELDPALLKQIAQRRPSLAKAARQASAPRKPQPKPAGGTPSRAQVETTPCGNSASDSDIVIPPDQARGPAARLAAEAMASKDPQRARQLLDEAETSVDRINDKSEALDEIVFVASAAHRLQRQESLRRLLDRSFALGDELTRMEQSQGPVYTPRAWVPLTSAVRLGMHSEPELTIFDIEAIRSPALKALLLVDAARSLPRK